jgi:transcriptional regulator with XRE-family HTH domain
MDMRQIVGSNLRRLRLAAGLSQDELAARTGLDRTYISGIENGRRNPTVIVLNDLAAQLGVDPRELLKPHHVDG